MAKLNMKYVEVLAPIEEGKRIIDFIQQKGVLEVNEYGLNDSLQALSTGNVVSVFENNRALVLSAVEVLEEYASNKKSLLSALEPRRELSYEEFLDRSDSIDPTLCFARRVVQLSKSVTDLKVANAHLNSQIDAIAPWMTLDAPAGRGKTENVGYFAGTLPASYTEESLKVAINEKYEDLPLYDIKIISSAKDLTCIFALAMFESIQELETSLRELGFIPALENLNSTPASKAASLEEEINANLAKIEDSQKILKDFAQRLDELEFACDYYNIRIDKYESLSKLALSDNIIAINGYAPAKSADLLAAELEEKFCAAAQVREPLEEEEPPVLLGNNSFVSPVESVTEMYSMPGRDDIDPNPFVSMFYYSFFGMMLSDAGYGLLMVLAALFVKKKFKLEKNIKKTVDFFLYCGIGTVFWGAMFGSWFGDIVQVVGREIFGKEIPSIALWFEPIQNPIKMLMFSFLFGMMHLFLGLWVNFLQLWKQGKKLDAVLDVFPVYLTVTGAAPLAAGMIIPVPEIYAVAGKYLALAGVVGVVLTAGRSSKNIIGKFGGGLYALYGVASGYLSDILSYSRLLALGLSTGVIASVVNVLGTLPQNKVTKIITLIVVFIFGHAVNFALNVIGSYVHTNRLHYVEFFSKFYEGGGRAFAPLKINTKHFKFKEEK